MQVKIGLSISDLQGQYGDMRALEIAKQIGADAVDFDTCGGKRWDYRSAESIYSKSEDELVSYFTALRKRAEELDLIISQTHGRIRGFMNVKEEDDACVANARLDCLAAATLGAPVVVMHSPTTIRLGKDAPPELMHALGYAQFTSILPYAKQYGVKIASETFGDATGLDCCDFFGNVKEFLKLYERVRATEDFADHFCLCADTGHSNKAMLYNDNPSPADVIRLLGNDVRVLHLNDNDHLTDQHKMPLSGTIDWKDTFDALDEIGYRGIYNMELNLRFYGNELSVDTAAMAIKVLRNYLAKRDGRS